MINSCVLVGRLANDPELKYTPSGMPVATFRLAVNRPSSKKDEVDWLNCVCWEKTAEFVAQYVDKGALVGIEGRIQSRSWEGQDGKRNYAVEIVAGRVQTLESKAETERRRAAKGHPVGDAPGGPEEEHSELNAGGEVGPFGDPE